MCSMAHHLSSVKTILEILAEMTPQIWSSCVLPRCVLEAWLLPEIVHVSVDYHLICAVWLQNSSTAKVQRIAHAQVFPFYGTDKIVRRLSFLIPPYRVVATFSSSGDSEKCVEKGSSMHFLQPHFSPRHPLFDALKIAQCPAVCKRACLIKRKLCISRIFQIAIHSLTNYNEHWDGKKLLGPRSW